MMDDIDHIIKQQAEDTRDNTLWAKPANDILNGRDTFASVKPVRAIWEMVQNARDVSKGQSNIVFVRDKDIFVFKHDGVPFEHKTLDALILQTSSKSRMDGDEVGQYGTGFLATHKMGRVFHLAGSLRLVENKELYYNFPRLEIDRSPNTREEMVKKLKKQFEETEKWRSDLTHRSENPDEWTVFSYQQPNEIERKNAEEAFSQAPDLVPYVLCLNEAVRSIVFQDDTVYNGKRIEFIKKPKESEAQFELSELYSTCIQVNDSTKSNDTIKVFSLESKRTIVTKKEKALPMVTVILPVCDNHVFPLSENISRLFLYLPLVGTEQWGVNFIIHAPLFTCSTDDRSSLRLIQDGQTENDPAEKNREYIKEATDMIFEYIGKHVADWEDVRYLAPVAFDVTNPNVTLSNYYKDLKEEWRSRMMALDLVNVDTEEGLLRKKPEDVYVLDSTLTNAVENNDKLLTALYNVLCDMYKEAVPVKEHLTYWSTIFDQWYVNEESSQIIGMESIIDHIAEKGTEAVSEDDLLSICTYLRDSGQQRYFDKNILLTEDGTLTNKTDGFKSDPFGDVKKASIKVLLPKDTGQFVKAGFAALVDLKEYTDASIKTAMGECTTNLQNRIRTVTDWAKSSAGGSQPEGLLSKEEREALMNYCRLIIPRGGEAFEANSLELIREFYDYSFLFNEVADSDALEWRGAIRTLLYNVMTEFTLLSGKDKLAKRDWIQRLVKCVFSYRDFADILQNYRVYLSQNGDFTYCNELKKDPGIPEGMKDIYNTIFSTDATKVEVRDELFDTDFGEIAKTEAVWEVVMFGNDIMDRIKASGKYLDSVDTYEHKDLIIDIINHFEDEEDGATWKSAFQTIDNDVPALLAKLVLNKENREPMIKIMKVKDKGRLNKVAEIIDNEHLDEIWRMGQEAWTNMMNEKADMDHKKALGEYVESYLLQQLGVELKDRCELDVKADVEDVQGGQDLIVYVDHEPVYYIEIKSRWANKESVQMSAKQLERSVEQQDQYALFAVDMFTFSRESVKEHVYPERMEDFVDRVKVMPSIGELNQEIIPAKRDPDKQVHIEGDYKAVVPQDLITEKSIRYNAFIDEVLIPKLRSIINSLEKND